MQKEKRKNYAQSATRGREKVSTGRRARVAGGVKKANERKKQQKGRRRQAYEIRDLLPKASINKLKETIK